MLRSHDAAGINWSYVQSPKRALSGARVGAEERATPRDACIRLGYHPGRAKLPKTWPCGVSGKLWIATVRILSVPVQTVSGWTCPLPAQSEGSAAIAKKREEKFSTYDWRVCLGGSGNPSGVVRRPRPRLYGLVDGADALGGARRKSPEGEKG